MTQQAERFRFATFALTALTAALAGCGGGGGDSSSSTTTPAASALSVAGTAATGAALATRPIDVKCASGSATATTTATGSYALQIENGELPCVIRVTKPDGTFLHGITSGAGTVSGTTTSAVANVTPVTELVVASAAGSDPATFFTAFSSTAASTLTSTRIATAQTAVISTLRSGGVDLTSVGDLLTGTLTPASGTTTGNAYDQALDLLATKLTSTGTTLASLSTTIAANATAVAGGVPTTSNVASLPADLLLKPASSNCSALRSARYRLVNPASGSTSGPGTEVLTFDAAAGTATHSDATVDNFTANGACRFTTAGGTEFVVAQSGIIVIRQTGTDGVVFGFPEQTIALNELAGDWIGLGQVQNRSNAALFDVGSTSITISASGALSNISDCDGITTCVTGDGTINIRSNTTDGGFDVFSTSVGDTWTDRLFAYRAGGGELMLVSAANDHSYKVWTKSRLVALPVVGTVNTGWNVTSLPSLAATTTINDFSNTIVSVNTTANSFLRNAVQNFTTGVTRPETLQINTPRNGYSRRVPGTATLSDNSTGTVPESFFMSLRGMGVTAVGVSSSNQLVFAVAKP